jgi:hypothetical protein
VSGFKIGRISGEISTRCIPNLRNYLYGNYTPALSTRTIRTHFRGTPVYTLSVPGQWRRGSFSWHSREPGQDAAPSVSPTGCSLLRPTAFCRRRTGAGLAAVLFVQLAAKSLPWTKSLSS